MQQRTRRALSLAAAAGLCISVYLLAVSLWLPAGVTVVPWPGGRDDPGGWSGIEVDAAGLAFWAIHDDAGYAKGQLIRDDAGRLTGAALTDVGPLSNLRGQPIRTPNHDSEGIARDAQGRLAVSFEWQHRIWIYDDLAGPATPTAPDPRFAPFRGNVGLEAVAAAPDGQFLTFRERQSLTQGPARSFLRQRDGTWIDGPPLPVDGHWSAVGADIGPDGRLYMLERRFRGIGFATRIRRMEIGDPAATVRTLYTAPVGRHGNLEGLAVWRDGEGAMRLVMVSDDNRFWFQRSQIVEVTLAPPQGGA